MSTYTVTIAAPSGYALGTMFGVGANLAGAVGTELLYVNPDQTRVVIKGSGFVFAGTVALAGTITSVEHFDSTQTTLYASYTNVGAPILDLYNRWFGGQNFPELALTAGDDLMLGTGNAENFNGFTGNDTINGGDGDDYIDPGNGADVVNGGNGTDTLSYSASNADPTITKGITVDLNQTTFVDPWGNTETISSIENIRSTRFADTLVGNASANRFEGLAGADSFAGGGGFDSVNYLRDVRYGGTKGVTVNLSSTTAIDGFGDMDTFSGIEGAGGTDQADLIIGGDTALSGLSYEAYGYGGDDTIKAGAFDMYIEPGAGNDTITGGASLSDQLSYQEYTGTKGATMNLATGIVNDPYGGTDTITGGIEGLRGTRNADFLIGNDSNNFLRGLAGNDTLDGGGGQDSARYDRDAFRGGTKGVVVDLGTGKATDGFGDTDTLISIERVTGTASADLLTGGDAALEFRNRYTLVGLGGDDTLTARSQAVYFEPGAGNDKITGSSSNDLLSYGDYTGAAGLTITLSLGSVADPFGGTDTFSSIESVRGTRNADTLTGDGEDNQFQGLAGADVIVGGAGIDEVRYDADIAYGGSNSVIVDLQTGLATDGFGAGSTDKLSGIESIRGTSSLEWRSVSVDGKSPNHTDLLYGDAGDNVFRGLRGNDLIDGRGGIDTADYSRDAAAGGTAGVVVDLAVGTGTDGFGTTDTLVGIENATGTDFADTLIGNGTDNVLTGGLGEDIIDGAGGSDTAVFAGASASYTVTAGPGGTLVVSGADGKDTLSNIEVLKFSDVAVPVSAASYGVAAATASLAEGSGGGITAFTFIVQRSGNIAGTGTVGFTVQGSGGAPAAAADFEGGVLPAGTVSFAAGEASRAVTVNVLRDGTPEANEGFQLVLSAPTGGTIGTGAASATILNDDTVLSIAATSADKPEGTGAPGATTPFTFTITRSGMPGVAQSVAWSVAGVAGTGTQPAVAADFAGGVLPSGTVSFGVGETSRIVTVPVAADALSEAHDRFAVSLASPTGGAVLGTASAQGIIQNDDTDYAVSGGGALSENTGGTRAFTFTVTRSGATAGSGTVGFTVSGTGPAPADGADFVGGVLPSGTVSFAANETSKPVTVNVAGDAVAEASEGFQLVLSAPVGGSIGTGTAAATILNDDTVLSIVALSANKLEGTGAAGATTPFTFTVSRTGTPGVAQTVGWSVAGVTQPGTAPAEAADFANGVLPSGTISFAAGETSKVLTVNVAADAAGELADRFAVTLASPTGGATLGAAFSAQGIIQNDDTSLRVVAGGNMTQTEGNTGPRAYSFTVQRQGIVTGASSAQFAVTGVGPSPADAGDFTGGVLPTGTVNFLANETSKTIVVEVAGDAVLEADEGFRLTLSNPVGAALTTASLDAVILSDDSILSVAPLSANKPEGTGPVGATTQFTFTVTRTGALGVQQTVNFTSAGIAGAGTNPATGPDFGNGVFPTGSLLFAPGQATRTITINVRADEAATELNERFAVTLTAPTGGAQIDPTKATAQGIIQADDFASTAANQTLNGTAAPDLFLLGGGIDTVFGKGGVDSFRFLPAALGNGATNATTIQDFNPAAGEKLDLSRIDAIAGTLANDAFSFNPVPGAGFSGAGSLVWQPDVDRVVILGDTDGNFVADLTLFVRPMGTPDATWFIL